MKKTPFILLFALVLVLNFSSFGFAADPSAAQTSVPAGTSEEPLIVITGDGKVIPPSQDKAEVPQKESEEPVGGEELEEM